MLDRDTIEEMSEIDQLYTKERLLTSTWKSLESALFWSLHCVKYNTLYLSQYISQGNIATGSGSLRHSWTSHAKCGWVVYYVTYVKVCVGGYKNKTAIDILVHLTDLEDCSCKNKATFICTDRCMAWRANLWQAGIVYQMSGREILCRGIPTAPLSKDTGLRQR